MFKNFFWFFLLSGILFEENLRKSHSSLSLISLAWETVIRRILRLETKNFRFSPLISFLFFGIVFTNLGGLLVVLPQNFIYKISFSLFLIAFFLWSFTYLPLFKAGKEKVTLFVVGEMKFPILSLLLSHIEILTHVFRPVTLTARLWVNIWVGHLIIRGISFFFCRRLLSLSLNAIWWGGISQIGFFLFEIGIISLQTFVFTYLIKVYFEENEHHSSVYVK